MADESLSQRVWPLLSVIFKQGTWVPPLPSLSARLVWDLLSDWSTREDIAESLAKLFGEDHGVISRDIEMVIEELIATEAVVVS